MDAEMIKWADYLISDVKYTCTGGRHIVETIRIISSDKNEAGREILWPREKVISMIKIGNRVCVVNEKNGRLSPGAYINVKNINGKDYLKAGNDDKEEDTLGNA